MITRIPEAAAERFIDRQAVFTRSIGLLLAEWNALLAGENTLAEWTTELPHDTRLISSTKTTLLRPAVLDRQILARPCRNST
jgi:hypothetical protein